ncbi:MAG: sulfatase-like hydrolase/transferase [Halanaeroarchaeum sp.]
MKIALIVLDTLRDPSFDERFDWLPGTRFSNAWSTSRWTVPAHGSLFTGLYPSESGINAQSEYVGDQTTIFEELSETGYETYFLTANAQLSPPFGFGTSADHIVQAGHASFVGKDIVRLSRIVDETEPGVGRYATFLKETMFGDEDVLPTLHNAIEAKLKEHNIRGYRDDGASRFLKRLRRESFPDDTFLFMNLMEPHAPYNAPPEYNPFGTQLNVDPFAAAFGDESPDADRLERAYEANVSYLADVYERIYRDVLSEFDLVVTLGDHGEMFGEFGMWTHVMGVYPQLTSVPLVATTPGDTDDTSEKLVNFTDVYRTLKSAAGMDIDGVTLHNEQQRDHTITEHHGITDRKSERIAGKGYDIPPEVLSTCRGVATRSGYWYQCSGGPRTVGNPPDDPEDLIADMPDVVSGSDLDLTTGTQEQLEKLGYL